MFLSAFKGQTNQFGFVPAWIAGQVVGFVSAFQTSDDVVSLMRLLQFGQVSIVWLLLSATLPFFIFYLMLRSSKRLLCIVFIFAKAFMFTYIAGCVVRIYTDASWLVQLLCFFTESLITPVFVLCILNAGSGNRCHWTRCLLVCNVLAALFVFVDYLFITPMAMRLLHK